MYKNRSAFGQSFYGGLTKGPEFLNVRSRDPGPHSKVSKLDLSTLETEEHGRDS